MTVDEFLAWAKDQEGRHELFNGQVYAMAPERAGHARVKYAVQTALLQGIRKAGLPCHMLPDGMTCGSITGPRMSRTRSFIADRNCPLNAVEVPDPVIVVEVLSPSTRRIGATRKLAGYFSLPSVHHYLIVDPERLPVIHHQRQGGGTILTRLLSEGAVRFDPPGFEIAIGLLLGLKAPPGISKL